MNIYTFWTGDNKMSDARLNALKSLEKITECNIILITGSSIADYILKDNPLHPGYIYLSETHKADYLRTYFMNFYGNGYSDIKVPEGSWKKCFIDLEKSDKWICGYKEVDSGGVAYEPIKDYWEDLIGNGAYICKPQTPLTIEWYNEMIKFLDTKLEELKLNPAKSPQDMKGSGSGYPIEWNEMLGRIFHKIVYKYKDKVLNTLPLLKFYNYR